MIRVTQQAHIAEQLWMIVALIGEGEGPVVRTLPRKVSSSSQAKWNTIVSALECCSCSMT